MRVGNKINSFLNGEWVKHARPWGKKFTSRIRRGMDKKEKSIQLEEHHNKFDQREEL